jgi:hypothetical protein
MLPPGPGFTMAIGGRRTAVAEHFDVIIIGTGAGLQHGNRQKE